VAPPIDEMGKGADKPEEGIDKNDPNGVLQSLNVGISPGILMNVHLEKRVSSQTFSSSQSTRYVRTLAKTPKRAIQRMNRIIFHAQTKANRKMKGMQ
jgi:hypothetical protein